MAVTLLYILENRKEKNTRKKKRLHFKLHKIMLYKSNISYNNNNNINLLIVCHIYHGPTCLTRLIFLINSKNLKSCFVFSICGSIYTLRLSKSDRDIVI